MVVKAVYDVRLAGDDEPIPMSERPELRRITEADGFPDALARYAAASRVIYEAWLASALTTALIPYR